MPSTLRTRPMPFAQRALFQVSTADRSWPSPATGLAGSFCHIALSMRQGRCADGTLGAWTSGGVDPGGVDPGGVDPGGVDPGGVDPGGVELKVFAPWLALDARGL